MSEANTESFEEVKKRLDEIVDAVADDDLPLDDALKLYEEAVQLGCALRRFWRRISRRTTRSMMKSAQKTCKMQVKKLRMLLSQTQA